MRVVVIVIVAEIMNGNVLFHNNYELCHEDSVKWNDIITGEGADVVIQNEEQKRRQCMCCDLGHSHLIKPFCLISVRLLSFDYKPITLAGRPRSLCRAAPFGHQPHLQCPGRLSRLPLAGRPNEYQPLG